MGLSIKHKLFNGAISGYQSVFKAISKELYHTSAAKTVEQLDFVYEVKAPEGPIYVHCDSETSLTRARKMLYREPETLEWIRTFQPDDVMWDFGSNIGIFTLYAAVVSKAQVVAFDPLPFNYCGLIKNITLNNLNDRVQAFCLAMTDQTRVDKLYVTDSATMTGGANCPFGTDADNHDEHGHVKAKFKIRTLGFTADDFLEQFKPPLPTHLKMDIDGPSELLISGARGLLKSPTLKSAMLELHPGRNENELINSIMEEAGFELVKSCLPIGPEPGEEDKRGTPDVDIHVTNNFFIKRT